MWLIFAVVSVLFSMMHLILTVEHGKRTWFGGLGALIFIILSLLLEGHQILMWVRLEDWTSLAEMYPAQYSTLVTYAILVIIANVILMAINRIDNIGNPSQKNRGKRKKQTGDR